MDDLEIRFDDGAAYEDFMGKWSLLAGDAFLHWMAPAPDLRWADIGCGNGAFTQLLLQRCAAREVQGVDPSEQQLAFARTRLPAPAAQFQRGDAMALPWADATFDAAAMALVIFFVPEPARGVAEMARVVKPGGLVGAYAWDILGGGFPFAPLQEEMQAMGWPPVLPPSVEASRQEALSALWTDAGLVDVEVRQIGVQRRFADFDTWWGIARTGPVIAPRLAQQRVADVELLQGRLRARLRAAADGSITCDARANAVRGRRPE
jgi:SAM-dependent methyltransferase